MRLLSVFVLVLSTLSGLHASAVEAPTNEQYHAQLNAVASHVFHAMASADAPLSGVSTACQASIDNINNNPTVAAAKQQTTRTGCLQVNFDDRTICPMTQTSATSVSVNCNCVETTNVAAVSAAVQALGGKMCPATVSMTMSASMSQNGQTATVNFNSKQTGGYQIYGPQCTSQDIQGSLDAASKKAVDAAKSVFAGNTNNVALNAINIQVTACSQSASATGAGSMVVVSWFSMLCVMVMSSLMMISF